MFALSDRWALIKKRDSREEDSAFAYGSWKHTLTHTHTPTHTHTETRDANIGTIGFSGVCVFIQSLSHSLLSASHISSSVVWGRLRAPCLRDLGALHRLYSMSLQSRSSCPFSPCWVQPVSFLSTLGYVMTKLTHLLWDGPSLCHF